MGREEKKTGPIFCHEVLTSALHLMRDGAEKTDGPGVRYHRGEDERPPGDRSSFAEGAERKIANFIVEEIRIDCLIS